MIPADLATLLIVLMITVVFGFTIYIVISGEREAAKKKKLARTRDQKDESTDHR